MVAFNSGICTGCNTPLYDGEKVTIVKSGTYKKAVQNKFPSPYQVSTTNHIALNGGKARVLCKRCTDLNEKLTQEYCS